MSASDAVDGSSAMPGWYRSLRVIASLVAPTQGARAYRALDAAGLREAIRQAAEERCRHHPDHPRRLTSHGSALM